MRLNAFVARVVLSVSAFLLPALSFAYDPDAHSADSVHAQVAPAAEHTGEHKKAFNPGKMIIEHISDNHEWHVYGEKHIPLPVIVKTDKGFEMFSSGNFRKEGGHEFVPYPGKNYTYALKEGKVVVWDMLLDKENEEATKTLLDVSITKNVVTLFIVVGLMLFFFISVANSYKKRVGQTTKGMQSVFEPLIIFVRDDIAKASIGKKYERYMPYLLTVFFFVWISNMLGLIPFFPGGANFTGNITITLCLAVITFIITLISANKNYWRHIFAMPGVPIGVLVILTPIEIFGMFLKPMVLMIRLFANITAGHIIALSFYALIFIFAKGGESTGAGLGVSVASVAFCVFMMFLELLVAFIQAYVFTLLSAIYFGSAVEEHHHIDENFDGKPNELAAAH
ncbi:MAG: F0F1 ATP synthase subunit A [Bacteroidota bacterium]|nr:F0F1 ATP synthase subunit A [Bacteroidota bacterium]